MPKLGLTKRQKDIYDFLILFHKVHGIYPTVREISEGKIDGEQLLKLKKGHSSTHRILACLQERGWISIAPGRSRAIIVL